jgi:hypothetical protein
LPTSSLETLSLIASKFTETPIVKLSSQSSLPTNTWYTRVSFHFDSQ